MNKKIISFGLCIMSSVIMAATYTVTIFQMNNPAFLWNDGVVMSQTNFVQSIIDDGDDGFDSPTTNAPDYLDDELLSTHASAAPSIGWRITPGEINSNLMVRGMVQTIISRDDMSAEKTGCIRVFSDLVIPESAYYCHGTNGQLKSASPPTINDTYNSFYCNLVNPAYEIPGFSITSTNGSSSVEIKGTVQSVSGSDQNILDDNIMHVRWRNLSTGSGWANLGAFSVSDGLWNGALTSGDFNSEPTNEFEFYAYGESARAFLPQSQISATVWLSPPDEPIRPTVTITPSSFFTNVFAVNIWGTSSFATNVLLANETAGSLVPTTGIDNWNTDINLLEGGNVLRAYASGEGGSATSAPITVTVITGMPSIAITSPNNGNDFVTNTLSLDLAGWYKNMTAVNWKNITTGADGNAIVASSNWTATVTLSNRIINYVRVYGENVSGDYAEDTIRIIPVADGNPFIMITGPNDGNDFTTDASASNVRGVMVNLPIGTVTNYANGEGFNIIGGFDFWSLNFSLEYGTNKIIASAPDGTGIVSDTINIFRSGAPPVFGQNVLSLWPHYIGAIQTGRVEFISEAGGSYELFAEGKSAPLAQMTATSDWSLIYFSAEDLPNKAIGDENIIFLQGSEQINTAGIVRIVEDLNVIPNVKLISEDIDGDDIYVLYKSKTGGKIAAQGRTLFVSSGNLKDKIIIKVKADKLNGDGVCLIEGILSDSGFSILKSMGQVTEVHADSFLKKIILKGGGLGDDSRTRLNQVEFDSLDGKSLIKLSAGKHKLTKEIIPANMTANIRCGNKTDSQSAIKIIGVKGGDWGVENAIRITSATSIKVIKVGNKKGVGGRFINSRLYLSDMDAKGLSLGKFTVDKCEETGVVTNGHDIQIICNYDGNPAAVTNWNGKSARGTIKKVMTKSGNLEGLWAISKWYKIEKIKSVKVKFGTDEADWYVDGVKE